MNVTRLKIWARHRRAGRVRYTNDRYSMVAFLCHCGRWHNVSKPSRYTTLTIEDAALNAIRRAAVDGCPKREVVAG